MSDKCIGFIVIILIIISSLMSFVGASAVHNDDDGDMEYITEYYYDGNNVRNIDYILNESLNSSLNVNVDDIVFISLDDYVDLDDNMSIDVISVDWGDGYSDSLNFDDYDFNETVLNELVFTHFYDYSGYYDVVLDVNYDDGSFEPYYLDVVVDDVVVDGLGYASLDVGFSSNVGYSFEVESYGGGYLRQPLREFIFPEYVYYNIVPDFRFENSDTTVLEVDVDYLNYDSSDMFSTDMSSSLFLQVIDDDGVEYIGFEEDEGMRYDRGYSNITFEIDVDYDSLRLILNPNFFDKMSIMTDVYIGW